MKLIMESWRRKSILTEGLSDLIKNKALDNDAIEKIGEKLSGNEGFDLAVQLFTALSTADHEEIEGLEEGPIDWIHSRVVQGLIAKENLVDTLKDDPRFKPVLKLGGPALALAFLYFKHNSGGVNPQDFTSAIEMIVKKGDIGLESLADAALMENTKAP